MGNKSSRTKSPLPSPRNARPSLYGRPSPYSRPSPYNRPSSYGRPSGSLYSASAASRTSNSNYGAPSPAERGMLFCKTKNTTPGPTPTALYSKKLKSQSKPVLTPKSLYSKPSAASTPTPVPKSLYSKKSKGSLHRGFSWSSISGSGMSVSGASAKHPSPNVIAGASAGLKVPLAQLPMTLCAKCRMPFGDAAIAFCRDCGHPRPAELVPLALDQRMSEGVACSANIAVHF